MTFHSPTAPRHVNKITLLGNVGRDPDIRDTADGRKAQITLATMRVPDGDGYERTDWHRLVVTDPRLCDLVAEHVRTGTRLYVEGTLQYDSYERDGVTIPVADIAVLGIVVLSQWQEAS